MIKTLPDKWVRKAVFDAVNGITVDGNVVNCFDTNITGASIPSAYILLTTQTANVEQYTKCEDTYECTILIDVVTTYRSTSNTGSRLLADNIMDEVRRLTDSLTLDVSSGLTIIRQRENFLPDISTITQNENIFRKLLRIELTIN